MESHGQCKLCGANLVLNPKTGKIFCSDKCWLKGEKAPGQATSSSTNLLREMLEVLKEISSKL